VKSRKVERLLQRQTSLTEIEASTVLEAYGISFPSTILTTGPEEARKEIIRMRGPVVMKVSSRDILHKSDVGGIIMGVTEETAFACYERILERVRKASPTSVIDGVLVQEEVPAGIEVIIGAVWDFQFGHAIMFGLGGVFAEVLDDVTFRIAPITANDAQEMMDEIQGAALLRGQRGEPSADIEALSRILVAISRLVEDYPQISELDLNPVIVRSSGAVAVDAAIRMENLGQA